MLNKIINAYGLFYPNKQKLLYHFKTKTLGETYSEIIKEKRTFYLKHYKKLLNFKKAKKKKSILQQNCGFGNKKVLELNYNLTKKKINKINLLNNQGFYQDLTKTKNKIKKLGGYSQYYDKVFF